MASRAPARVLWASGGHGAREPAGSGRWHLHRLAPERPRGRRFDLEPVSRSDRGRCPPRALPLADPRLCDARARHRSRLSSPGFPRRRRRTEARGEREEHRGHGDRRRLRGLRASLSRGPEPRRALPHGAPDRRRPPVLSRAGARREGGRRPGNRSRGPSLRSEASLRVERSRVLPPSSRDRRRPRKPAARRRGRRGNAVSIPRSHRRARESAPRGGPRDRELGPPSRDASRAKASARRAGPPDGGEPRAARYEGEGACFFPALGGLQRPGSDASRGSPRDRPAPPGLRRRPQGARDRRPRALRWKTAPLPAPGAERVPAGAPRLLRASSDPSHRLRRQSSGGGIRLASLSMGSGGAKGRGLAEALRRGHRLPPPLAHGRTPRSLGRYQAITALPAVSRLSGSYRRPRLHPERGGSDGGAPLPADRASDAARGSRAAHEVAALLDPRAIAGGAGLPLRGASKARDASVAPQPPASSRLRGKRFCVERRNPAAEAAKTDASKAVLMPVPAVIPSAKRSSSTPLPKAAHRV